MRTWVNLGRERRGKRKRGEGLPGESRPAPHEMSATMRLLRQGGAAASHHERGNAERDECRGDAG